MVQMNSFAKQKESHRCRHKPYSYQGGWDEAGDGIGMYTLLCIKQITNENLLYSAGKSPRCSLVTEMVRNSKKDWIYVYA